jgi:lipoprotein-anchoring transpeptidase ErfK/SrfK
LTITALTVAAGAWGWYAYRFSTANPSTPQGAIVADSGNSDAPLTTLRATTPETHSPQGETPIDTRTFDAREGLTDSIHANAPPAQRQEIEITLKQTPNQTPLVSGASSMARFDAAKDAQARGDLIAARSAFCDAIRLGLGTAEEQAARNELERMAQALVFSRATNVSDPLTGVHIVAPGDSANAIARKLSITQELLLKTNQMTEDSRLAIGQRIKVIRGPFHAKISKSAHRMDVFLKDTLVRSFNVGLGTNGTTPTGTWLVADKLINPDWTDPSSGRYYLADDPNNPIGERWIGLKGLSGDAAGRTGFGLHGTIDPSSIGQNMSMGCVRLAPDDVIAAYDLFVSRVSQLVIEP